MSLQAYINRHAQNPLTLGYAHERVVGYFSDRPIVQRMCYLDGNDYGDKFREIEELSRTQFRPLILIAFGAIILVSLTLSFSFCQFTAFEYAVGGCMWGGGGAALVIAGGLIAFKNFRRARELKSQELTQEHVQILVQEILGVVNERGQVWERLANQIQPQQVQQN